MNLKDIKAVCVIGLFWGDEGKGKIVDLLTQQVHLVVRYNGGANAGHTVVVGGEKFALHLVPSGSLHEFKTGVIGPGVALDPGVLIEELDMLSSRGIDIGPRLKISTRCHLVMPWHKLEDRLSEAALSGSQKIGTTARGIGPCYADKMRRSTALRFCDLFKTDKLSQRIAQISELKQAVFSALYDFNESIDAAEVTDQYLNYAQRLKHFTCDTTSFLQENIAGGKKLLFEGAHGTLLDIDHGTYPYVTSSSSSAVGVPSGSGVPPATVNTYIGVVKAYTTRVGQGPFPTEQDNEIGDRIRHAGQEFGTTTGRPRRCGWFDAVAGRYGVQLGGINNIAVMHLDTLSGFKELKVCVAYELHGERLGEFPAEGDVLEKITPVYETLPGWDDDITAVTSYEKLPQTAQSYIGRLEELLGAKVAIVSVGPDRSQTIFRNEK